MSDLTKADAVAALRRAAAWNRTEGEIAKFDSQAVDDKYAEVAEHYLSNAAILRALADALEQAHQGMFLNESYHPDQLEPGWWIPTPRLP